MREILFRGKCAINIEWAYSRCPDGTLHSGVVKYDFIPATVGQFTGMTDKNGKKIFEGDIVKWKQYVGCIVYFNMDAMYFLEVPGCPVGLHIDFDTINSSECKIIGNIHDNPELLEGA